MSNKPESLSIDGVDYIREDLAGGGTPDELSGAPYVIVRSRDQGVMSGYLESVEGRHVKLSSARQLWSWKSDFTLVEGANSGFDSAGCKFSAPSKCEVELLEACGILHCTETAGKNIRAIKSHSAG